jgi:uncharacterized membrane protein SpoIIM required for sporulation/uncharacterized RDD family membrane protein YckC
MPPSRGAASLDQYVEVETPEQIVFSYTVAGVGSRAAAAIIDFLFSAGLFFALLLLLGALAEALGTKSVFDRSGAWLTAAFLIGQFAILFGYYVLWEALADGQTPGKRKMGLRVVQDGGYSITFAASAVRNLVRILDMQPGLAYGVGIVSVALSKSGKRIGDIVAGTMVVQERVAQVSAPAAPAPPAAGANAAAAPITARLSDDEFALLERFVARRQALEPARRSALASQLVQRLRPHAPDMTGSTDVAALLNLHEQERQVRARGVAARSDTGAQREQHAIVAQGRERWSRFAAVLADAQRRGLRSMKEEEVSDFVAQYRELTTDLARLRTAARGREIDALFYLSRLVAAGHNLFYRRRELPLRTAWRYMAVDVPREVRRSWRPVLLSTLLTLGSAAAAATVVARYPETAEQFISPEMIDRAETAGARERRGERFLRAEDQRLEGAYLSSAIMTNNVRVTFVTFALGITVVGTALFLVFQGVAAIGGPVGLYIGRGVGHLAWGWVAAHGVLELAAIVIAGAGGLLISAAILLPGPLTRREALVVQGRRAIRLIACSTLLLVFAGLIEGNVSPSPWPNEAKYFVALVTGLLMLLYLTRGRGRGAVEVGEENAYR